MKTLADKAEWALKLVASDEPMAFDTETSGLDYHTNWPIGYVFTDLQKTSVYIPLRHKGGGNLAGCPPLETPTDRFVRHPFEEELQRAFRKREAVTIGHNLKFDWHFSLSAGVLLNNNLYCTQMGAALLDEHSRDYSLEHSSAVRGLTPKKGEIMYQHLGRVFSAPAHKNLMARFWELPGDDPIAVEYAEGDGITTLELQQEQVKDLTDQGLVQIANVEMALIRHVAAMERRGVKVDLSRMDEIEAAFKAKLDEIMATLPAGFNAKSSTMMFDYFTQAGHTNWPKTEKGNPSFPEKWLLTNEPGRKIVDIRKIRTINESFVAPMKERHAKKGRVHPSFHPLRNEEGKGTGPGRFSCSDPNLQQVPKHNHELSKIYRSIFVPDEGYDFWEGDYSQCEPRLFAHYARVPILVDGYNSGTLDMHDATAKLLDVDRDTVAKRMNMGLLTGMWPKTFAMHMDWNIGVATAKWNEWFRAYPEIKTFQDNATALYRNTGFIKTILGRRCRMDDPRFAYKATSRIIQGSNADILKYKLLQLCGMIELMDGAVHMLLTVHDSFNWQAEKGARGEKYSRELVQEAARVQQSPFNLRVPFTMDVKKGSSWSDATFGKKMKFAEAA